MGAGAPSLCLACRWRTWCRSCRGQLPAPRRCRCARDDVSLGGAVIFLPNIRGPCLGGTSAGLCSRRARAGTCARIRSLRARVASGATCFTTGAGTCRPARPHSFSFAALLNPGKNLRAAQVRENRCEASSCHCLIPLTPSRLFAVPRVQQWRTLCIRLRHIVRGSRDALCAAGARAPSAAGPASCLNAAAPSAAAGEEPTTLARVTPRSYTNLARSLFPLCPFLCLLLRRRLQARLQASDAVCAGEGARRGGARRKQTRDPRAHPRSPLKSSGYQRCGCVAAGGAHRGGGGGGRTIARTCAASARRKAPRGGGGGSRGVPARRLPAEDARAGDSGEDNRTLATAFSPTP